MNEYIKSKHVITEIAVAIFVQIGKGDSIHKNRLSHSLAFNCGETKKYIFNDGSVYIVEKHDIIYLPKNSNYKVQSKISGNVYCINFQYSDEKTFPHSFFVPPTLRIF